MGKRGPKPGSTLKRKGGYHLSSMAVGESKVIPLSGDCDLARLSGRVRNIAHMRKDMRFYCMSLPEGIWVKRLS